MTQQYLFIDFEFTMPEDDNKRKGFLPEIIEVGVVAVRNQEVFDRFSSYVKPKINPILTECCKRFLNIIQELVDTGIPFPDLLRRLSEYERKACHTVVTWGNKDMHVLRNQCLQWGFPFPFAKKEIDLSMEHKRFYGGENQTGLVKALTEYGQSANGQHHRALDDAMITFEIFKLVEKDKQYLKKAEPSTIGDVVDFSSLFSKLA